MAGLTSHRVQGVVLAGGSGLRMGRDKAGVVLRGRTLLARTCERLAPQCAALAISRRQAGGSGTELGVPILDDAIPDLAGPLAGILAALDWSAADVSMSHVATVAVDTPFLPMDLVSRLAAAQAGRGAPIACAASRDRVHPVAALWPVAIRRDLRACVVDGGTRRVMAALEQLGYRAVEWPAGSHDPFLNVNTAADLAEAETVAASIEGGPRFLLDRADPPDRKAPGQ